MKIEKLLKGNLNITKINGKDTSDHLYFNSSNGTYLYLCMDDPPTNKLDSKFKKDSKIWNSIFINVHSDYKVLI